MKKKKYTVAYAVVLGAAVCTALAASLLQHHQKTEWVHQHRQAAEKPEYEYTDGEFCTHLPLVSITTDGTPIPGVLKDGAFARVQLGIVDNPLDNNHALDARSVDTQADIHYRGNSSLHFDKKSYLVKFVHQDGTENKQEVMGMPSHDEWVLNGPFLDKTLMRNYMCMNVSAEIMGYAPRVRFCELLVDGEYQGVYVMMESIEQGEDRVPISKCKEGDQVCSYILRVDRGKNEFDELENFTYYARKLNLDTDKTHFAIDVKYPSRRLLTPELKSYIEKDFSRFEKSLYSFDYDDPVYGYRNFVDVDSFVDYFVINEFFQNYDAMQFSTYFYKDLRGRIHLGPVWDYNNACDNYMETSYDGSGFLLQSSTWYYMMSKDEYFIDRVTARYRELRKSVLSEEYLMDYIDGTVEYLGDAVDRNYEQWGYSFHPELLDDSNKLSPDSRNPESYEASVEQLKDFIRVRGRWMDRNIDILKQYCHESKIKKFNH